MQYLEYEVIGVYLIFRCDCGRVLYSKDSTKNRKCPCGKTLNVKKRRILKVADDAASATEAVQQMQEEIYGGTCFKTADLL